MIDWDRSVDLEREPVLMLLLRSEIEMCDIQRGECDANKVRSFSSFSSFPPQLRVTYSNTVAHTERGSRPDGM